MYLLITHDNIYEFKYVFHVLQVSKLIFLHSWQLKHFPGCYLHMVHGKWLLSLERNAASGNFLRTIRGKWFPNKVQKTAKITLFCYSFIARSLGNHFTRTIPQKVLTSCVPYTGSEHFWGMVCMYVGSEHFLHYWYTKSESKFENISTTLGKKLKFLMGLNLGLVAVNSCKTESKNLNLQPL